MLASQKPRLSVEPTHPALPCSSWDPKEPVVEGLPDSSDEKKHSLKTWNSCVGSASHQLWAMGLSDGS